MKSFILQKKNLTYWLRQMRKTMELIAQVRERGDIIFKTVDRLHEIALDCHASIPSPKEFLVPQYEPLLKINKNGTEDLRVDAKRVIFGVRSCDVSAIRLLDRFYLGDCEDAYYKARRKNTLFISIACGKPESTCFCSGIGSGPYLKSGEGHAPFDIQLYDLGDRYFVEAGSKEAVKWVKDFSFLMTKPGKADLEDQYEVQLSARAMFQKRIDLEGARRRIEGLGDDFWRKVSDRCFECGGCVYECPLCTCFTVIDRPYEEATERARIWDTCFFKGFTRMAGGHLPNADRINRTKRWFYHKLVHYPERLGGFGCVGCGRCAVACPARIDMAAVVSMMKDERKE